MVDLTPGSTLVTGNFAGEDLKNLLDFLLIGSAAHPGKYFPRAGVIANVGYATSNSSGPPTAVGRQRVQPTEFRLTGSTRKQALVRPACRSK